MTEGYAGMTEGCWDDEGVQQRPGQQVMLGS